jgi:pimeloyl-ACP methyl ester carboxylesterase
MRLLGPRRLIHFAIRTGALGPLDAEQAHRLEAMLASSGTRQMIAAAKGITTFDSRPWLAHIPQPTLIIAGNNDPAVPLAHAQMLVHGIGVTTFFPPKIPAKAPVRSGTGLNEASSPVSEQQGKQ